MAQEQPIASDGSLPVAQSPLAESSANPLPDKLPDAREPQQTQVKDPNSKQAPANQGAPASKQQPKRILGIMPNYRAVSAGAIPPPPTPKQAFKIATQDSFDYSSFVFVGLTSMIAEGEDTHHSF